MSKSTNRSSTARAGSGIVEIKSKFDAEFRRFGLSGRSLPDFEGFCRLIDEVHGLRSTPVTIWYTDHEGDLLPINNGNNYSRAISTARPLLRLNIQRKGQAFDPTSFGPNQKKQKSGGSSNHPRLAIGFPEDFRQISAIIDVHIVPECHRRVRLMKNSSDRPLGFYIRDGTSVHVLPHGLEKVPAIFISRLVVGGLAESTGLLAVNDEVLEVNGIEVFGKTLDQVTDMMVANSSNLIITIKPANNHNDVKFNRETSSVGSRSSQKSAVSYRSEGENPPPNGEEVDDDDEEDVVEDHTLLAEEDSHSSGAGCVRSSVSKVPSEKNQFSVITL